VWLHGVHISPYSHGNRSNVEPDRIRKLLLRKAEIRYLIGKTKERGYTLVPLKLYTSPGNLVKVEIGLARGKKLYDKRESIAERDHKRDVERALKERTRGE
jgi:SsrA-binding protein